MTGLPKEFLDISTSSLYDYHQRSHFFSHPNQQNHPCPGKVVLLEVNSAFKSCFSQDRPAFIYTFSQRHWFRGCRLCTCCWRTEICFSRFLLASSSSSSCSLRPFFSSSICFSLVLRLSLRRVSSCRSSYKANNPVELAPLAGFKAHNPHTHSLQECFWSWI